jgi:DNA-binding MarR family transcriptional regulator
MTTITETADPANRARPAGPAAQDNTHQEDSDQQVSGVSAELERTLTSVARAILRLDVPKSALAEGETIDRAGYWLLLRVSRDAPMRLSDLAEQVELDLSTVSRQMRDLVGCGLIKKVPDPNDGRASLLSLSERGWAVLASVSEARQRALARAIVGWSDDERNQLAAGLLRLEAGLLGIKDLASEEGSS